MKKVLIINSAKGGVGKTETSVGIAKELHARGEVVSMLDLDITTPNVKKIDGIDVYTPMVNMMMSKSQIQKMMRDAVDNAPDGWIIVDTPPTISELYAAINETIKNAKFLFVTTPSENAVNDTLVGIKFFAQRGHIAVGVIQNMVGEMFGEEFDSSKVLGVETLGTIPLTKNTEPFFKPIVDKIMTIEFKSGYTKGVKEKVMSTLTVEEIEYNTNIPLRFYNLETWDIIRERLEEKDSIHGASSHFSISTKDLKAIIDKGSHALVMIKSSVGAAEAPLPYEIHYAEIAYDNEVSKGLPMFKLASGLYLWHHECFMVSEKDAKQAIDDGGYNVSDGRIVQSLMNQMYLNRAFARNGLDYEVAMVRKHIEITQVTPDKKDIAYIVYKLEREGNLEYDEFDYEKYIESQEKDYPDYAIHLKNLVALGE